VPGTGSRISPSLAEALERLRRTCDKRELVHPDPLEFLYAYEDPRDRELAGLVASSLAYGRVGQILRSVEKVLSVMDRPARFVAESTPSGLASAFRGFKHRFTTGEEVGFMLLGAKRMIEQHGSLEKAFARRVKAGDETVLPALCEFTRELNSSAGVRRSSLVPLASDGSACKRMNLFLRWMVRRDAVDPGGWSSVPASKLIVPLDTHMHRVCVAMGFTRRRQADMKAALEATSSFRELSPQDPVRYDFSLTRLGIRPEMEMEEWIAAAVG